LKGLSPSTPIILTVDQLPLSIKTHENERETRTAASNKYVDSLYHQYLNDINIKVIASMEHWHVGGTIYKALKLIHEHYPSVEFLYYTQHDLEIIRNVNHLALIGVSLLHSAWLGNYKKCRSPCVNWYNEETSGNQLHSIQIQRPRRTFSLRRKHDCHWGLFPRKSTYLQHYF
jgi:hypothetical protein